MTRVITHSQRCQRARVGSVAARERRAASASGGPEPGATRVGAGTLAPPASHPQTHAVAPRMTWWMRQESHLRPPVQSRTLPTSSPRCVVGPMWTRTTDLRYQSYALHLARPGHVAMPVAISREPRS